MPQIIWLICGIFVCMIGEIETVLTLSRYNRLNKLTFSVWTNDPVIQTMLGRYGVKPIRRHFYELSLLDFNFLPRRRIKTNRVRWANEDIPVLPNDTMDKETHIGFTKEERLKKILHITTDDEYFLHKCKKLGLEQLLGTNTFVSHGEFAAFAKRAKRPITDERREELTNRLRDSRRISMLK